MLLWSLKLSTVGFRVYTLGEFSPAAQMVNCASGICQQLVRKTSTLNPLTQAFL